MKSLDNAEIYAVLWVTVIYFNMKTRKSEIQPFEITETFKSNKISLEQKTFEERVQYFRMLNKSKI